jgi:hypothetical protein
MSEQLYAIGVAFENKGSWTKPYTYKAKTEVEVGSLAVVKNNTFFDIGKVVSCASDYKFNPDIKYRGIYSVIKQAKEAHEQATR